MGAIAVEYLVHINQLLGEFAEANDFYARTFDAQEYMNAYHPGEERDASLFLVGDTCIELFSPRTATSLLGRQLTRFGDSWHSFEWKVDDLERAKAALDDRGIRTGTYYPGGFLMTHPKDCHGLLLEMCPTDMANDPRKEAGWSSERWSSNPLGIMGLNHVSVAVLDLEPASDFLIDLVGAVAVYEAERKQVDATARGMRVADHVIELITPRSPDGDVADYIEKYGPRIRSIQFRVRSLDSARAHLAGHGLRTIPGDSGEAFAIDPRDNYGVLWQFTEQDD